MTRFIPQAGTTAPSPPPHSPEATRGTTVLYNGECKAYPRIPPIHILAHVNSIRILRLHFPLHRSVSLPLTRDLCLSISTQVTVVAATANFRPCISPVTCRKTSSST